MHFYMDFADILACKYDENAVQASLNLNVSNIPLN